jgi:hypothetical protein
MGYILKTSRPHLHFDSFLGYIRQETVLGEDLVVDIRGMHVVATRIRPLTRMRPVQCSETMHWPHLNYIKINHRDVSQEDALGLSLVNP